MANKERQRLVLDQRDGDDMEAGWRNDQVKQDIQTAADIATAVAAIVIDSIADADTTHAPSRNAVFDALALKAPLASPTFTGDPKAPTPSPGDNDTSIATTAFVAAAVTSGTSGLASTSYVDAAVAGLSWKQRVRAATTGAGTLASSFENGDALDGVTLATGDRILIKDQASGAENGIYTVNPSGAPTRATDADSGAELVNASCYVSEGTANADTQWTCSTNAPITVGVTALVFVQLSTSGGQAAIQFKDEGSNLGTSGGITVVDFVGAGVTATESGGVVTVTIASGSASTAVVGSVIQHVVVTSSSAYSSTTAVPYDSSKPQKTEGAAFLSGTIVPLEAGSKLRVRLFTPYICANAALTCVTALFRDAGADCITMQSTATPGNEYTEPAPLEWEDAAGSTASTQFDTRFGSNSGGFVGINRGNSNATLYGNAGISKLEIEEIKQ